MENTNNEQNIEIAEIKKDVKYIREKIDSVSVKVHDHCLRIRATENNLIEIKPLKKLYDKAAAISIGIMITLGIAVISLALFLWEKFKNN